MTLLVSWIGVDTHGIASAYIAADSRISWGDAGSFDHGRKVFAFSESPDILGYCGDVLFPSIVLGQIAEMANRGLLFASSSTCKERFEVITETLVRQFSRYPHMVAQITSDVLQVLYVGRDQGDNTSFSCWMIEWRRSNGWSGEEIQLPTISGVLKVLGSGGDEFRENMVRYQQGPDHGTSRCTFHCFCDTLFNIQDQRCGGAPQLVGLYRKPDSSGVAFGVIKDRKRYFLGAFVDDTVSLDAIEWRNDLFERCDGTSMKRIAGAQKQPDALRRN
jgi:hypothetical protein